MKNSGNSKKYEKANSLVETDQSAARKVIRLVAEDRAENRGDDISSAHSRALGRGQG